MSLFNLLRSHPEQPCHVYEVVPGDKFLVARHRDNRGRGRPNENLWLTNGEILMLARFLQDRDLFYPGPGHRDGFFRLNGSFQRFSGSNAPTFANALERFFVFAEVFDERTLDELDRVYRAPVAVTQATTTRARAEGFLSMMPDNENILGRLLAPAFKGMGHLAMLDPDLICYGGTQHWPTVGRAEGYGKVKVDTPPPPESLPSTYPHLKALAEYYPLDPSSHAAFHGYLLGCFHASAVNEPIPFLVIDSWTQGMGKSELAASIFTILEGDMFRDAGFELNQHGNLAGDALSAHFSNDTRVAVLDNVSRLKDWTSTWLCNLLTNRSVSYRLRYNQGTTAFTGLHVTATLVFGDATLSDDIIARTWRVQVAGGHDHWGQFPYNANPRNARTYAKEHREALIAECYAAVHRTQEDIIETSPASNRFGRFYQRAAAAYQHVFDRPFALDLVQPKMLSTPALQLLISDPNNRPELTSDGVHKRISPIRIPLKSLAGGTACGFVINSDGKPERIPDAD